MDTVPLLERPGFAKVSYPRRRRMNLAARCIYAPGADPSMSDSDPLEHPRVTLPKNLSETLKRLEDAELETLLREVIAEAERRGVMKSVKTVAAPQTVPAAKFQARQSKGSGAPADLPAGKANLIKASHSAGMKP